MGSKYRASRSGVARNILAATFIVVIFILANFLFFSETSELENESLRSEAVLTRSQIAAQKKAQATENVAGTLGTFKSNPLFNLELANERAPESFVVEFTVSRKGQFRAKCTREWAPQGVDRFYNLVKIGFYDNVYIFRVIRGFMMQFGINSDPRVTKAWRQTAIPDDPFNGNSNTKGLLSFAMSGPNSRTTQLFLNYGDNSRLDRQGFVPICHVTDMKTPLLVHVTGEGSPSGPGPAQGRISSEGGAYIAKNFPQVDKILTARII
mmetsp:Transcript_4786/g.5913  ORF Transcript_4786/g.5913 Transcript_4786/m.5913 type:complete len:266 (+) Transcript_4786:129-926(+)